MKIDDIKAFGRSIFESIAKQYPGNMVATEATPPKPAAVTRDPALDDALIKAAGDNCVSEIAKLLKRGADINARRDITVGSGTLIFSASGDVSQPKNTSTPLMVALHHGAFEAALFLINSGADASFERSTTPSPFNVHEKALDIVLTGYV